MILTINGGSSSIKFSVYEDLSDVSPLVKGKIDRIGLAGTHFEVDGRAHAGPQPKAHADTAEAASFLLDWLDQEIGFNKIKGIGHRIVHGLDLQHAAVIDKEVLHKLKSIRSVDPDHLPGEIQLIELLAKAQPDIPQVACFDTAFHATLPRESWQLPIPRKYEAQGIRRYGFHGLSYAYLAQRLAELAPEVAAGRVIMAHLGNGASMTALLNGKSVDTSMGFSPVGGFMMGTRSGDLDPGLVRYLMHQDKLSPSGFNDLVNHESGLLGISETSSDVRDLLKQETSDPRAAEALTLFCYQIRKWVGAFAAALGGIDALVFSGGIGENAAPIRQRVCADLGFLGITLEVDSNEKNKLLISNGPVPVYVLPTNEEIMIARITAQILK